jgi:hypothetical protein
VTIESIDTGWNRELASAVEQHGADDELNAM